MGVVPEDKKKNTSPYLKAEDFKNGIRLEVVAFKTILSKNPKFGAVETEWMFKADKLKLGETFSYTFKTMSNEDFAVPEEKTFESKSAPFFIAFSNLDPEVGDKIWIKRSGEGTKTQYVIEAYKDQK